MGKRKTRWKRKQRKILFLQRPNSMPQIPSRPNFTRPSGTPMHFRGPSAAVMRQLAVTPCTSSHIRGFFAITRAPSPSPPGVRLGRRQRGGEALGWGHGRRLLTHSYMVIILYLLRGSWPGNARAVPRRQCCSWPLQLGQHDEAQW